MQRLGVVARIWFALIALVVLAGFVVQFYLLFTGGADANSGETGSAVPLGIRFVRLFSFFTIQSNLLVLAGSALLASKTRLGRVGRVLFLDALLGIIITGLVFSFILAPDLELRAEAVFVSNLFHLITPTMFVIGWLLFGPRRQFTITTVAWALAWPAAWLVGTFVRGAVTGWYPYPFLDANVVGYPAALTGAGIVILVAATLMAVVLLIDNKVPAVRTHPRPEELSQAGVDGAGSLSGADRGAPSLDPK
ncbi:Pr6Pr family membrane protein [Microbacterium sp. NPDC089698]|uniref:Pr6Pr family membrane protein n=1 Tax=Microbacterium sp. NPDC089698 TaxID=3364200 RepID=UPI0038042505